MLPTKRDKFSVLLIRFLRTSLGANIFQNHIKMFHWTSTNGPYPSLIWISDFSFWRHQIWSKYQIFSELLNSPSSMKQSGPRSPRTSRNSSEAENSQNPLSGIVKLVARKTWTGKPNRVRPTDRPTFKHAFACGKVGKHDGSAAKLYWGDRPRWSRKPRLKLKVGQPIDIGAADTLLAEEGNYQVSVNEEKLLCCSADRGHQSEMNDTL